jgi:hypothetical protein
MGEVAEKGQFDLGVTPLTVSGASGMGDETHFWRTRRASVYKGADPGRPNWKARVYRGTYPERPKWKSRFKPLDILGFDVEDLRAKCWPQVNSKNRLPAVVRRPIAVTIRALADEPFTAQRQTHFAAHAGAMERQPGELLFEFVRACEAQAHRENVGSRQV